MDDDTRDEIEGPAACAHRRRGGRRRCGSAQPATRCAHPPQGALGAARRARRSKTIAPKRLTARRAARRELLRLPRGRRAADDARGVPDDAAAVPVRLAARTTSTSTSIRRRAPSSSTSRDLEVWEMAETCSLDVADRGGITLEEVGAILNLTRERIRQVEVRGLLKLKMVGPGERAAPGRPELLRRRRRLRELAAVTTMCPTSEWAHDSDPQGPGLGLRQARRRRSRARPLAPRDRDALDRRHGARAARSRRARHRGRRRTPARPRSSTAASRRCTRASTAASSAAPRAEHRGRDAASTASSRSISWSSTSTRSARRSRAPTSRSPRPSRTSTSAGRR